MTDQAASQNDKPGLIRALEAATYSGPMAAPFLLAALAATKR